MAVKFASWGNQQFVIPTTGAPASGYKLYTYVAGSSTLVTTYTTYLGDVEQSNPIILNSAGLPTNGQIWITEGSSVKIVFTDDDDVVLKTEDRIPGVNDASVTQDQWVSGAAPTYISATSFSLVGDQTSTFQVGRRLKTTNSGGTVYSTITASTFGAVTTVVVANDSGTLDSGLSAVSYGLISKTGDSMPRLVFPTMPQVAKFISGLTYSNNGSDATNDIDIAAGTAIDATGVYPLRLASALTKQSDAAWAVGTNAGALDTGAVGNSDYYIWLIARSDTGVVDVLFSLQPTSPTMPANYDYKRLIGWFKRSGGAILAFKVYEMEGGGIQFAYSAPIADVNLSNTLTTSRRTDPLSVPLNFSTIARVRALVFDASSTFTWLVCCPDETDAAPSQSASPGMSGVAAANVIDSKPLRVRTSSAGAVAGRATLATVDTYVLITEGFEWGRR